MNEIEALLIQALKLAVHEEKHALVGAILSLPGMFVLKCDAVTEAPPFEPDRKSNAGFRIPSGKFRGRVLAQLSDGDLQNVWAGFNGCGNMKVANILKAEIDRRR